MRTREQRWAARSARGWPRLRVHAVLNGLGALVAGGGLLWFTHGPLQFRNFPAGDVAWVWRVVTLALAVLVPYVLLAMGGYLLLAGATATQRAALAAGRSRTVVLNPDDPDEPPVTVLKLTEHTPPGVKIRAHALHGRHHDSRYSRDLLGLLPVQSPVALAPLVVGILALLVATVYYSTGYGEPATVLLLGIAHLGWKLFRGWRSHRVFSATRWETPAELVVDTGPVPHVTPLQEHLYDTEPATQVTHYTDDDAAAPPARDRERAASYRRDTSYGEEPYETTDELPVIEQIRERYAEPRRQSKSQRRLTERAEREAVRRRLPRVVEAERAPTDTTAPITRVNANGGPTPDPQTEAAEQQQQRLNQKRYEDHLQRHQEKREDRLRNAEAREPEEAPSLLGYAMNRLKRRGDGS
ncbi:hypothetical protein [Kocuria rhizophila]|uniref:hypothetical protein n=1 Tax=Kocuria rhizophila TaxID=72000 RepID=UPI001EF4CB67|nr:hypothetical protein [Kocuria rhizophila]MCG7424357.1 hypothetical protein [Kocuria rhizophila]MCT1456113.1 hypothetical protein [Kocuria rhizophila]MCT1879209.1 hypothetical protein [Kocuria rhizophila]MCT2249016.1 hypothetical protein [Kocuria rhizophila]